MNVKMLLGLMLGIAAWWLTSAAATQAQSGCPAQLPAAHDYAVVEAELLVPANLEQASLATPNDFIDIELTFDFDGQGRVFLSSSNEALSPTCVDDYLEISGPLGELVFDYRSADRSRIEFQDPLTTELTPLLKPGANVLRIRLVDVGQYYSNSQLYLVTVTELPPLMAPTPEKTTATATATVMPTSTPTVTPTAVGQAVVNLLPTATPTQTVVVSHDNPPQPDPVSVWTWSWVLIGLILLMLTSGVLWSVWRNWAGTGVIPGELEIYKNGQFVKSVTLAALKKAVISVGAGSADIWLPGDSVPERAARLFTKKDDGQFQPFLISFSGDGQIHEERRLYHEDSLYIGEYRLVYKNYAEEEPYQPIGEFNHA